MERQTCARCGRPTFALIMSMFNTQELCVDCHDAERKHPRYHEACEADLAAIKRGDHNFPGIGWTEPEAPEQPDSAERCICGELRPCPHIDKVEP